ncbi:hypothetical protein ATB93_02175 [Sphingomonas sp. WG]|nr:hypothetical protein ATB93_02175 [Sphingomonas sp. WG]
MGRCDVGCLHSAALLVFAANGCMAFIGPAARTIRALRGELVSSAKDDQSKRTANGEPAPAARPDVDLADALKKAYDETVNESVPDDLLDLLKKLG